MSERKEFIDRFTKWLNPKSEPELSAVLESTTLDGLYTGKSDRIRYLIRVAYGRGVRRGAGCVWEAGRKVTIRK